MDLCGPEGPGTDLERDCQSHCCPPRWTDQPDRITRPLCAGTSAAVKQRKAGRVSVDHRDSEGAGYKINSEGLELMRELRSSGKSFNPTR